MKTEYLRRDPFPQPSAHLTHTGSLPSPVLACPGSPPSSLPSSSAGPYRCSGVSMCQGTRCLLLPSPAGCWHTAKRHIAGGIFQAVFN